MDERTQPQHYLEDIYSDDNVGVWWVAFCGCGKRFRRKGCGAASNACAAHVAATGN